MKHYTTWKTNFKYNGSLSQDNFIPACKAWKYLTSHYTLCLSQNFKYNGCLSQDNFIPACMAWNYPISQYGLRLLKTRTSHWISAYINVFPWGTMILNHDLLYIEIKDDIPLILMTPHLHMLKMAYINGCDIASSDMTAPFVFSKL